MVFLQSNESESTSLTPAIKDGTLAVQSTGTILSNECDARNDSPDERILADDDHKKILAQFGFGAGMRMYEKSLAAAREREDVTVTPEIQTVPSLDYIGKVSSKVVSSNHQTEETKDVEEIVETNVAAVDVSPEPAPISSNIPKPASKGGFLSSLNRTISNISKSTAVTLTRTGSNVSKVGSVVVLSKSPSLVQGVVSALGEESSPAANVVPVQRTISNVSKAATVSQNSCGDISKTPTMSRVPSTISKAPSVSRVSSTISKAETTPNLNITPSLTQTPSTVSKAVSMTKSRSIISKAGSEAPSHTSKIIELVNGPSLGKIPSTISLVESKEATTAPNDSQTLDVPLAPEVAKVPSTVSKTRSGDISPAPSMSKAPSMVSKAVSKDIVTALSESKVEPEDEVVEVDDLKRLESRTEILDKDQAESLETSSQYGGRLFCADEVVYIREGKHVGFIPGLEDQTCCAAEEAVVTWFSDADEMANAGPENLLPFDEAEENKPQTPASKWFFW
jgi:hypothetical protein